MGPYTRNPSDARERDAPSGGAARAVQPSLVECAVVLFAGVMAGLLVRFLLALVLLIGGAVGVLLLLGYVSTSQVGRGLADLEKILAALGFGPSLLFTLVGTLFLAGMCGGVLLTTRVRAFDRASGA